MIGVIGVLPAMPDAFPLELRENAGNMIHGNAPFEMFGNAVHYKDLRYNHPGADFREDLRRGGTHVVATMANTLRIGDPDPARYVHFRAFLESFTCPIVIFGLGAQAPSHRLPANGLPRQAIELMKFLGDRTELIGVRGEFTAEVFRHYAGVTNTFVTGCPSFFSRPFAFDLLANALAQNRQGRPAFNGTSYREASEGSMVVQAIRADTHWVESTSAAATRYARELQLGVARPPVPSFLKEPVASGALARKQVETYFSSRFRLFHDPRSWYAFNADCVGFTYGTRFHGNMASLLAGVPALWVNHDGRTAELTEYLRLPVIALEEAAGLDPDQLRRRIDYAPLFDALPDLFDRFNSYLRVHRLPEVGLPDVVAAAPAITQLGAADLGVQLPSKTAGKATIGARLGGRIRRAISRTGERPAGR